MEEKHYYWQKYDFIEIHRNNFAEQKTFVNLWRISRAFFHFPIRTLAIISSTNSDQHSNGFVSPPVRIARMPVCHFQNKS